MIECAEHIVGKELKRQRVSAGTIWGETVGYSRAIRMGNVIVVSGTSPSDEKGNVVGKNDSYAQTVYAIRKIQKSLMELGGSLDMLSGPDLYDRHYLVEGDCKGS